MTSALNTPIHGLRKRRQERLNRRLTNFWAGQVCHRNATVPLLQSTVKRKRKARRKIEDTPLKVVLHHAPYLIPLLVALSETLKQWTHVHDPNKMVKIP